MTQADESTYEEFLDWMCISIHKEKEDLALCVYRFTTTRWRILDEKRNEPIGSVFGLVEIRKSDGTLKLIEPMPGDSQRRIATRAAQKIASHWAKGELPENTMYAAG
ncbi:hypothetical protein WKW79_03635 [Variovorax robiniae]|uniref:Uncharacterized protein n=1 Tax=Variovorax robiniae TaxID=1836199 RepID=A0ABU8X4M2_9BURK